MRYAAIAMMIVMVTAGCREAEDGDTPCVETPDECVVVPAECSEAWEYCAQGVWDYEEQRETGSVEYYIRAVGAHQITARNDLDDLSGFPYDDPCWVRNGYLCPEHHGEQ